MTIRSVTAKSYNKDFEQGATIPSLMFCENKAGTVLEQYVVKLRASITGNERGLVHELVGAMLATHLGFLCPEPVIVRLGLDFPFEVLPAFRKNSFNGSIGLNFGSKYIQSTYPFSLKERYSEEDIQAAFDVFVFDALIQNLDRSMAPGKPNLLLATSGYYLIDHEKAFPFTGCMIGGKSKPWELSNCNLNSHVFRKVLKQKLIDDKSIKNKVESIDQQFWDDVKNAVPSDWDKQHQVVNMICEHIRAVQDNLVSFMNNVRRFIS